MTIEEYIVQYLSQQLEIPVSGDVPSPRPASFVTVERTGGSEENLIPSATVAVQAWAPSRDTASLLCAQVEAAMAGITARPEISACNLNSSYNFTDTTLKTYRYQAIFELVYFL